MVMLVVTPQYMIWSRPRKCANLLDRMFVKQSLALARLLLHHLHLRQLQDHPEGLASQEGLVSPVEAEMEVADLVEVVTSLMVMAMTEMVVQHPTVQVVLVVQVAVLEALDGQVAAAAAEDPGG